MVGVYIFFQMLFCMSLVLLKGYIPLLKFEQAFRDNLVYLFYLQREDTRTRVKYTLGLVSGLGALTVGIQ